MPHTMSYRLLGFVLAFSGLISFQNAYGQAEEKIPSVDSLLESMAQSVKTKNYFGAFTYEREGKIDSLRMAHAVFDEVEYESIYFLNGVQRQFSYTGRDASCETFSRFLFKGGKVAANGGHVSSLDDHYTMTLAGVERVADRLSWIIDFTPKDASRYGVLLSVDQQSGLPLKYLLKSKDNRVLERFQFVSLNVNYNFQREQFTASDGVWFQANKKGCITTGSPLAKVNLQPHLRVDWLPVGYGLVESKNITDKPEGELLVDAYSDGLHSFSIIVEVMPVASLDAVPMSSASRAEVQKGATFVVSTSLSKGDMAYNLSVVGEIPPDVARQVLLSVRL